MNQSNECWTKVSLAVLAAWAIESRNTQKNFDLKDNEPEWDRISEAMNSLTGDESPVFSESTPCVSGGVS